MSLTLDSFAKKFPEFSGVSQSEFDCALEEARNSVSEKQFGCKACDALGYFVAHLFSCGFYLAQGECGPDASAPGPISSVRVGSISTSYAVNAADGQMGASKYGRAFLQLKRSTFADRGFGPIAGVKRGCGC